MKLVKTQPNQVEVLVRISKAAFESDCAVGAPEAGGPPDYDNPAWHEKMRAQGHLYTALEDEEIVGGAIVFLDEGERPHLYIGRIFVDPIHFQKGYGMAIMAAIEEMNPSVCAFLLDTPIWNRRTNRFYQKLGYAEVRRDAECVYYCKER